MNRTYVHKEFLEEAIRDAGTIYKRNTSKHNIGDMKDPNKYRAYKNFYDSHYIPMRSQIENMVFDENDVNSFSDCEAVLTEYWNDLKTFMKAMGLTNNSKIHTNFLEEFSCYFLSGIEHIEDFEIYTSEIFAGLKITPSHEVEQITKDVDFCIGNKLIVNTDSNRKIELRIPAISVEVKSYVDATMLGEIMNSARKIKGANPGSKVILLTWINSFADEHVLEAAYDSSIDEIVVMSEQKRKSGEETKILFTKEGLRDYYSVMKQSLKEVMQDEKIPSMGRLLANVKHIHSI